MEPFGKRWTGLFLTEEGRNRSGRYDCYHIRAEPVVVYENGCVRNVSWERLGDAENTQGCLEKLRISCQGNAEQRGRGVYAWEVEYDEVRWLRLQQAKAIVKTLETIDRKMAKAEREWGPPATYGQFVLRVAKAIGAKEMIWQTKHCRASSYDEMDLRRAELAEGAQHIDWWIGQWQLEGEKELATA